MKQISALQYITNDSYSLSHAEQALLMFQNGIDWVQIRMKNSSEQEIIKETRLALNYADKYNATLILNDHVELAKKIGVHGVHLGLNDVAINKAREILKDDYIIGGTANTFDDINLQFNRGADYIGLGPFRYTTTKKNLSPVLGLEKLKLIQKLICQNSINCPIVVVGGITMEDIKPIKEIGFHGVAISSALLKNKLKISGTEKIKEETQ